MAFNEQRLLEAIRAIDRARSLSDILDALMTHARCQATRVGLLLVRGHAFRAWRLAGFGAAFDNAPNYELPLHAGVVGQALGTAAAARSLTASELTMVPFGLAEGCERIAVPISMCGQVVAVLYADQGSPDSERNGAAAGWPVAIEVMTRHAARCLEALTAFKTARAFADPGEGALAAPDSKSSSGESPGCQDDENEAARRYARLLVSEIKLYHEAAVAAGQRERDLATRLGSEIARARALYEHRVSAPVRRRADHFQTELVRTLANGDARMLGTTES